MKSGWPVSHHFCFFRRESLPDSFSSRNINFELMVNMMLDTWPGKSTTSGSFPKRELWTQMEDELIYEIENHPSIGRVDHWEWCRSIRFLSRESKTISSLREMRGRPPKEIIPCYISHHTLITSHSPKEEFSNNDEVKPPRRFSCLTQMWAHPKAECSRVSRLHENSSWACELANQAFTGTYARYNPSTCNPFKDILAVPRHQMTIVNDVLFPILQLNPGQNRFSGTSMRGLTSFLMIAPKLANHMIPLPLTFSTNNPSPENIALLNPWFL